MRTPIAALLIAGCRLAPVASGPPLAVPGAPEGCRASWVFPGPPLAGSGAPFRQVPGVLEGAGFGACTLLGPDPAGAWRWVVMSFEPAFRGEVRCLAGGRRSRWLRVGGPEVATPDGVKVDLSIMDAAEVEAAASGAIPTRATPCGTAP